MQQTLNLFIGAILVLLWGALGSGVRADHVTIDRAVLISDGVEREVSLPHTLDPSDFDPDGSIVTYRLTFDMAADGDGLQGIYISKLSLSGRLMHNGQLVWACGAAELSQLRCLHRPHLIKLPASFLNPRRNVLDFEIYADSRQMNGLSSVIIGPYEALFYDHYQLRKFLKTDLVRILAIFAGVAGFLSLAAGFTAQRERLFLVFGAAAIFEVFAASTVLVIDPIGNREITSWLVFTGRFVAVLLKLVLFYEAFGRLTLRDPLVVSLFLLMAIGPIAFAVTDSNRFVVMAIYFLVAISMTITTLRIARWTYLNPSRQNIAWSAAAALIFSSSLHDYLRLGGAANFDGVYLLFYVFPVLMIIMGIVLFARMGMGLRVAKSFNRSLKKMVEDRTAELQSALTSIQNLEASALRLTSNIPIGTFILKTWGRERARSTFVSESLRKMIDLPQGAELPFFSEGEKLLHPADSARSRVALRRAIDHAVRVEVEFRICNREGNWRWLRCMMLPQAGSALPVIWDGVVIDVSETREAEERLRIANASLVAATAAQSRMEERQRLLQDIHDGFGNQLAIGKLRLGRGAATSSEAVQIVDDCLDDLRLVFAALDAEGESLWDVLSDLRVRVEKRLRRFPIVVTWDIDAARQIVLEPRALLQAARIVQEAIANSLRHANADALSITVRCDKTAARIMIEDDGHGFDVNNVTSGRGVPNMRRRALNQGWDICITSADAGSCVTLTLN
jgi:signal transduction histidine kinase